MPQPSIDTVIARNNAKIRILVNGQPVGRVQSLNEAISNNVQVLSEIGSQFAVELKKGITTYTFTIARFYCRKDAFEGLKLGQLFALEIQDRSNVADFTGDPQSFGAGQTETLESFQNCSITTISRDFVVGQAVVAENATVVTIGQGQVVTT